MRSTILKGEPSLHIHSLRYYLYTIYIILTLNHVCDAWFDIWLMICESLWDKALLFSTSITAGALVSNVFKTRGRSRVLILSGEDFFSLSLPVFVFRRWVIGADRGGLEATATWLISVVVPLVENAAMGGGMQLADRRHWLAAASSWMQLPRGGGVRLYIHGCLGHAWGMWTIYMAPRQGRDYYRNPPLFKSLARKRRSRLWCCFLFLSWRLF